MDAAVYEDAPDDATQAPSWDTAQLQQPPSPQPPLLARHQHGLTVEELEYGPEDDHEAIDNGEDAADEDDEDDEDRDDAATLAELQEAVGLSGGGHPKSTSVAMNRP